MEFNTYLIVIFDQVNYWKRLQLNSAIETQAESVVAGALIKEPVVVKKTGITSAFGIGDKIKQQRNEIVIPPELLPKVNVIFTHV